MGTIDKALGLLPLFSSDEPQWTVEDAAARMGVPTSTAYRYFRSLAEAGLIVGFSAGKYVIGPGIIELDRLARQDPLIVAAQVAMDDLADHGPANAVVLLGRIYRRRVMCVDQRPHGLQPGALSYERGRPMPLYRGSVSKIILANLPSRTLARYYAEDHKEIARAGLGENQQAFRETLRAIRREGWCISRSEVDKDVTGIAAPIWSPAGEVLASMSLVIPNASRTRHDPEKLVPFVVEAARTTSENLKTSSAAAEPMEHAMEATRRPIGEPV